MMDFIICDCISKLDDDYYYYVKAVPKMSVAKKNVTIKKFNSSKDNRGAIHTESYEIDEDDE